LRIGRWVGEKSVQNLGSSGVRTGFVGMLKTARMPGPDFRHTAA
jgi:hypothetical protein